MQIRKRITLMVLVMLVVAAVGAYANGQIDKTLEKKESVTLTGNVVLKNRMLPELTANGKTYYLLVPHFLPSELKMKDGDQITVSGSIVVVKDAAKMRGFEGITDPIVLIEKATIGGKEYTMSDFMNKYQHGMKGGKGGGMMRGFQLQGDTTDTGK